MTDRSTKTEAVRIAVLDDALPTRFRENVEDTEGLCLVHEQPDLELFLRGLPAARAQVVIVDLNVVKEPPEAVIARIREVGKPRLVLALYSFMPRGEARALSTEGVKLIKQPTTLRELRFHMMSVIMERIFDRRPDLSQSSGANVSRRTFTRQQLGRLQELSSSVQCECPQNLSELVQSLIDFEDYSKACENRNEADTAVHTMLYQETARARAIMEEALVRLCKFEDIEL